MTPEGLLRLWERGLSATAGSRARILASWDGAAGGDDLLHRPLGELQLQLAAAWWKVVGAPLDAVVDCPRCDEPLELAVELDALPLTGPDEQGATVVDDDGRSRRLRLLTSADLAAVLGMGSADARAELVRRAVGVDTPSPSLQRAVAAALEAADPASSLWVGLACPRCGHGWEEPLDLGAFLWHAVHDAAGRLLAEVADLAAAYGWPEEAILALPPSRRAAYLELAVR